MVINYNVPIQSRDDDPAQETYIHRIGRTGRFGTKGVAFNFISSDEVRVYSCYCCKLAWAGSAETGTWAGRAYLCVSGQLGPCSLLPNAFTHLLMHGLDA